MPRIRTIKPEFWTDEKMAALPRDARLLFIGLLNFADDEGRMRGSPILIRSQVFPYDPDIDTESLLRMLVEHSMIVRYEGANGEQLIWIRNFNKHQKIDRPVKSALSPPPRRRIDEGSTKTRRRLDERSTTEWNGSGNGRGRGEDKASAVLAALAPPGREADAVILPEKPKPGRTVPTRQAYEAAYQGRYQVKPALGKQDNGMLARLLDKLPAEEAPDVAAFYLGHNLAEYVRAGHPIGLLLRDAGKLRMEWATGRQITDTEARAAERTVANAQSWNALLKGDKHGVG